MLVKLREHPESLSEHELLEILLYSVVKRQDTNPLAHRLLRYFNSLQSVFDASIDDLIKVDGVGPAIARFIKSTGMIMSRTKSLQPLKKVAKLNSVSKIKNYLQKLYKGLETELFTVLFLDEAYDLLSKHTYSTDGLDNILLNSSDLVNAITIAKPSYAIVAHNHPSGIIEPSASDNSATAKLYIIFAMNNVCLFDHLIFGKDVFNECYSYHLSHTLEHIKNNCNIDALLQKSIENI